ncbi:STAS domain-containing protein, partial [Pararhodobacter sp.]|uniref:STAS domain-containing protein n=1 Tax=Pararhodobacter sp. TaxID=2127056 RepID=UPI002AFF9705
LAALAGVLATVAWNMIERHAIATLFRSSRADAAVLMVTLLLTVFRDLTEAIVVGFALGSVLFIHRMSKAAEVSMVEADGLDDPPVPGLSRSDEIMVYRIRGAFFFGAAASVGAVLERIADTHRALVVDFADAALVDSTAIHTVEGLVRSARRKGVLVILTGASADLQAQFRAHDLRPPEVEIEGSLQQGVARARALLGRDAPLPGASAAPVS